jgi:hypothetical protein
MSNQLILAANDTDYPLLNVFWTLLYLFLWILWIFLVFRILTDVFRSRDLSGGAKAGWSVFIIILPFIGVLSYIVVRGSSMHTREVAQAHQTEEAFRSYVQLATGTADVANQLERLAALRDQGVLTDAEFTAQKAKLLA